MRNRERSYLLGLAVLRRIGGGGWTPGKDATPESKGSGGACCALLIPNYFLVGRAKL